jgi:hypothetical protein
MIDRIDHGFLDGGLGEIPEPLRLRPLRMLDDRFLDVVPLDEIDGVTKKGSVLAYCHFDLLGEFLDA